MRQAAPIFRREIVDFDDPRLAEAVEEMRKLDARAERVESQLARAEEIGAKAWSARLRAERAELIARCDRAHDRLNRLALDPSCEERERERAARDPPREEKPMETTTVIDSPAPRTGDAIIEALLAKWERLAETVNEIGRWIDGIEMGSIEIDGSEVDAELEKFERELDEAKREMNVAAEELDNKVGYVAATKFRLGEFEEGKKHMALGTASDKAKPDRIANAMNSRIYERKFSDEQLGELVAKNMSMNEIAAEFGVVRQAVQKRMHKLGLRSGAGANSPQAQIAREVLEEKLLELAPTCSGGSEAMKLLAIGNSKLYAIIGRLKKRGKWTGWGKADEAKKRSRIFVGSRLSGRAENEEASVETDDTETQFHCEECGNEFASKQALGGHRFYAHAKKSKASAVAALAPASVLREARASCALDGQTVMAKDPESSPEKEATTAIAVSNGAAAAEIARECDAIKAMLLSKNAAYGNSALDPVRVFSRADPVEQLNVRIDDKLSRLARGAPAGEDVELDLIGYLLLLRIAKRRASPRAQEKPCPPPIAKSG